MQKIFFMTVALLLSGCVTTSKSKVLTNEILINNCKVTSKTVISADKSKPIFVFVHGSGPIDYTGKIGTINFFDEIASELIKDGYHTLQWSKRTAMPVCAKSIGSNPDFTPSDLVDDLDSIIQHSKILAKRHGLRGGIVVFAHSQGVTLFLNSKSINQVRAAIFAAGTIESTVDTLLIDQLKQANKEKIYDESFIQSAEKFFVKLKSGQRMENKKFLGAYPKFWRDWIKLDAANKELLLQNSSLPFLAIYGSKDKNIPIKDFKSFKEIAERDKKSNAVIIENVDHLFSSDGFTVSPILMQRVLDWSEKNL